ncbi:hypothetical protein [Argonema galeatum]|uniref:hypothetical protein n=1 Tax=Argonema galeatum TaxID=2942762 RepID=UPI002011DFD7|nr:hypothetical protein [Argonema galeatum]MCL1468683.1 hypothetical protein [Argonema galeatum A003/A1]
MGIVLGDLLSEVHKIAPQLPDESYQPIPSFEIEQLSRFNLAVLVRSDTELNGYRAADLTIKSPIPEGDLILQQVMCILDEYQLVQVKSPTTQFKISVDVPFWLRDLKIKIWECLEMPVSNTGNLISNITRRLETATSTEGVTNVTATATVIVAANSDRTILYATNTGNEWVTIGHKAALLSGQGILLSPNGGNYAIESGNLDKRGLWGVCATGKTTTVAFYEGTGEEVAQT